MAKIDFRKAQTVETDEMLSPVNKLLNAANQCRDKAIVQARKADTLAKAAHWLEKLATNGETENEIACIMSEALKALQRR